MRLTTILPAITLLAAGCAATGSGSVPSPQESNTHKTHQAEVHERGDQAMGFSQKAATHHFRLTPEGGAIEVEANDPKDTAGRDKIRMHLEHISQMFAEGDFDAPMFIHDQTPPGVPVMQRLKADIKYEFERTERGARVRIKTSNEEALAAVHDFLRFQIKEHETGDPVEIQN
ncbi:MAG TPA: hypothetical protein VJT74_01690 [Pyrinomonadaceae bacterium]|nr:hypothetical protein [Pyrinomonadaceae bacterium]